MAREKRAHPGPFAADARQGPRIGDRVGAAAAVRRRHRHAENVVLLRQRQDFLVERVLDVAELFNRPNLFAKGFDIGQELLLIGCVHRRAPPSADQFDTGQG